MNHLNYSTYNLEKDIPILKAHILSLYKELDKKFHLHGADLPICFDYSEETLGSYTRKSENEQEHFRFSLLFIGYGIPNPISKEDRLDLFKHEYAHYMHANMSIPAEYNWQSGTHGSAWKYCCSLIGAAPTPYYKIGEGLLQHDYSSIKKKSLKDNTISIHDNYTREQEYQRNKNRQIQYTIGDEIIHPKFGRGIIENIEQLDGSVRLHIKFGDSIKKIDQKWLLKTNYQTTR